MGSFVYIPGPGGGGTPITITGSITFAANNGLGTSYPNLLNYNISGRTLTPDLSGLSATSGATPSYQWYRNGVAITSGTGYNTANYTLQDADMGCKVFLRVTYTNAGGYAYIDSPARDIFITIADKYPNDLGFAWWLWLLKADKWDKPLLRVRKGTVAGGNYTSQDIYCNANGYVDESAILAFGAGSAVFVDRVYDQFDTTGTIVSAFIQTTESLQYRIANAGVVDKFNGLPCFLMTNVGQRMTVPGSAASGMFNFLHDATNIYSTIFIGETAVSSGSSPYVLTTNNTALSTNIGIILNWTSAPGSGFSGMGCFVTNGTARIVDMSSSTGQGINVTGTEVIITLTLRPNESSSPNRVVRRCSIKSNASLVAFNLATAVPSLSNPFNDLQWSANLSNFTNIKRGLIIYKTDKYQSEIEQFLKAQLNLTY